MHEKPNINKKKLFTISILAILCVIALASNTMYLDNPEITFTPDISETVPNTEGWSERTDMPEVTPDKTLTSPDPSIQENGTILDNTQVTISETETGSVTNLTELPPPEASNEPPAPPVTKDDITNPDQKPAYDISVPQVNVTEIPEAPASTAPPSAASYPSQVYDPVFGWVTPSSTKQDIIDNDGDINKQIGTMGNN